MKNTEEISLEKALGRERSIKLGGYVGDILEVTRAHLKLAIKENLITKSQAGDVYSVSIDSAISKAFDFMMKERLTELEAKQAEENLRILRNKT